MPLAARRTFRLAGAMALALAAAYGLGLPLPYLAPLFVLLLGADPSPPLRWKGLLGLLAAVAITLSVGLLLAPMLQVYPLSALLIIALGLYLSTLVAVKLGKVLLGTLLAAGLTLIPAAGLVDTALAAAVIEALLLGIVLAILCQWVVYPLFPEDPPASAPGPAPSVAPQESHWVALRATAVIVPPVLLAFTNPALYLPLIMKSILLAQQGTEAEARAAGSELLGSTLAAGGLAILFWFALKLWPVLWLFFLLMLLFGIYLAGKIHGVLASRHGPSFWSSAGVTMLILLGPAVADSQAGKDVYEAFAVRFSLFVAVTIYAWGALALLERLRSARGAAAGTPRAEAVTG